MNARTKVDAAARSRLEIGEPLLAGGFAWIAVPRPGVSLLVLARRPHLVGITDRRLMIWARPHAVRSGTDPELVLDQTFDRITLEGVRTFSPMLQVRISTASEQSMVLEFRPRGRRVGHRLVSGLGGVPTRAGAEVPTTPS